MSREKLFMTSDTSRRKGDKIHIRPPECDNFGIWQQYSREPEKETDTKFEFVEMRTPKKGGF